MEKVTKEYLGPLRSGSKTHARLGEGCEIKELERSQESVDKFSSRNFLWSSGCLIVKRTVFHFWVRGARYSSDEFGEGNCPPRLPVAGSALRFAFLSMRASAATGSTAFKRFFALLQTAARWRLRQLQRASVCFFPKFLHYSQCCLALPRSPQKMSLKCSGYATYSAARFCRLTPVCSPTIWLWKLLCWSCTLF